MARRMLGSLFAAIIVTVVGAAWSSVAAQAPAENNAPAGNADAGQKAYTKYGCYECHGREGQGAPGTGPRLGPNPLPIAAFLRYVRAPRDQMPPYTTKVVTDQELIDIRAFLAARPRPPAVETAFPPN